MGKLFEPKAPHQGIIPQYGAIPSRSGAARQGPEGEEYIQTPKDLPAATLPRTKSSSDILGKFYGSCKSENRRVAMCKQNAASSGTMMLMAKYKKLQKTPFCPCLRK